MNLMETIKCLDCGEEIHLFSKIKEMRLPLYCQKCSIKRWNLESEFNLWRMEYGRIRLVDLIMHLYCEEVW